jgi:hypothetical protein
VDTILDFWCDARGGGRTVDLAFLIALLGVCCASAYIGAPPALTEAADYIQFFDGGWRVLNGQRPHVDFSSVYGVFFYLPMAAGWLFSHSARSLGYGNAIVGLIVGLWAYGLASRRLNSWPRFLAALLLTLVATAPYPLGYPPTNSSHAMSYNRLGYALLGILLIEAYPAVRDGAAKARSELAGGISSGLVCGILFFLKPTYFLAAIGTVGLSSIRPGRKRAHDLCLIGAFGLVALGVMWYLHWDAGALFRDLRMATGARSEGFVFDKVALDLVAACGPSFGLLLCALLVPLAASSKLRSTSLFSRQRGLIFAAYVSLAGFCLLMTNWQHWDFPLSALFAFLLAAEIQPEGGNAFQSERRKLGMAVLALTMVVGLPQMGSAAFGFGRALLEARHWRRPETAQFDARLLAGYAIPQKGGPVPPYVLHLNDGIHLLRTASGPRETVATLDFSNPFSYALERPPFRGGSIAMQYQYTFSDQHKPSAKWLLGGADLVMVPKYPVLPLESLIRNYGEFLRERFRLCAESPGWFLYRTKQRPCYPAEAASGQNSR